MVEPNLLERITSRHDVFSGKPIIRGMRISVELILSLMAQGESAADILADYPDLQGEDIRACFVYALAVMGHDSLEAVKVS